MPLISILKTYADLQVLNEVDIDNIKNSIETFLNITKIDAANIQDLAITSAKIATGAVTETKLATDSVTTIKIKDLAVTEAKLDTDSVTNSKIATDAVDTDEIKALAVTSSELGALAVTTAKIDALAVTNAKLAGDAVTTDKILNNTITGSDIDTSTSVTIADLTTDDITITGGGGVMDVEPLGSVGVRFSAGIMPETGGALLVSGGSGKVLAVRDPVTLASQAIVVGPNPTTAMRIIRGKVLANGTIDLGEGFSVSKVSGGQYDITFSVAFTGTPVVVASAQRDSSTELEHATIQSESTTGVTIFTTNNSAVKADNVFHFIAIGLR